MDQSYICEVIFIYKDPLTGNLIPRSLKVASREYGRGDYLKQKADKWFGPTSSGFDLYVRDELQNKRRKLRDNEFIGDFCLPGERINVYVKNKQPSSTHKVHYIYDFQGNRVENDIVMRCTPDTTIRDLKREISTAMYHQGFPLDNFTLHQWDLHGGVGGELKDFIRMSNFEEEFTVFIKPPELQFDKKTQKKVLSAHQIRNVNDGKMFSLGPPPQKRQKKTKEEKLTFAGIPMSPANQKLVDNVRREREKQKAKDKAMQEQRERYQAAHPMRPDPRPFIKVSFRVPSLNILYENQYDPYTPCMEILQKAAELASKPIGAIIVRYEFESWDPFVGGRTTRHGHVNQYGLLKDIERDKTYLKLDVLTRE